MSDWRYLFAQNRGTLLAIAFFVVMFAIYTSNHPAGFSANVVQTAANKGVLLALVAMAQTFVVITAGIDLSVGAVLVLTNCLASWIVVGTAASATLGVLGVLLTGLACGAINGLIVIYGRLQPIVATIATGAVFFGLALLLRPVPGGDVYGPLADALTGRVFGVVPASLVALAAVVLVVWVPYSRSAIGRAAYAVGSSESAAYMSGVPVDAAKFCAYVLSGLTAALGGLFLTFVTYSGEASAANGNTYTLFSIAAVVLGGVSLFGGSGSAIGAIFGALDVSHHWRSPLRLQSRPAVAAALPGSRAARRGLRRLGEGVPGPQPAGAFPVSENAETGFADALKRRIDPPVAIAFGCVIVMLFLGSLYSRSFLSPEYLLQQLKVASFLGVIATGTMIVILLGQIDLSIPWVVAVGGMMSTAATGWGPVGEALAIPFGVACGVALGLVNGFGVAYLRIPSMIITLAVNAVAQGLMVAHTGGFSPQDSSSPAMRTLATGEFYVRAAECAARLGRRRRRGDLPAQPHHLRPRGVRHRQSRARRLSVGHRHPARGADRVCACRRSLRVRRRVARRIREQGGAGDGRRLPVAGDRRRRAWRRVDPRRPRLLSRHRRRRHSDHASAVDFIGGADAGRRPADHLRNCHCRDAIALWT